MTGHPSPAITSLKIEHHRQAFGIGQSRPRLSWKLSASAGWEQQAYQVSADTAGESRCSDWIGSTDSVLVPWPLAALASRERVEVRVRVRGADCSTTDWSDPICVELGLLQPDDWAARVVSPSDSADHPERRHPPLLRTSFDLGADIALARLYVTAHGLYEVEINGRRVGDHALAPGWTSYHHRLRYQTFDVTDLLRPGANAIGAWLADGWFRGRLGFHGGHVNLYGDRVALLAQLEVLQVDGTWRLICTDGTWRSTPGPIQFSGLLEGETYDARTELRGWSCPGFDDGEWGPVVEVPRDLSTLVAPTGPPVRCTEELRPVEVRHLDADRLLIDFGQNLVGRVRLTVSGPRGHAVTLRHAEVLQDGELCVRPLRGATSTDTYVLAGQGIETWEPRFTLHGFRYAEVTGWVGDDPRDNLVARVHHTDMERTGWFSCSDPQVDRLHRNIVWSMRGNFVDLPTDCPQRDERLGWTGDIQVFAPTAAFLYDCHGMLASWLQDVAAEQLPDGTIPWYVPAIPGGEQWTPPRPGAAWGDVVTLTPWDLYAASGDTALLAAQYESARRWVELITRIAGPGGLWNKGYQLGDWLDPAAPPEDPSAGRTDRYLIATAYYAWSARHLSWMAQTLGDEEDHRRYTELADQVRDAFLAEYGGDRGGDTQTAYAVALQFGLFTDEASRDRAGRRLADLVRESGHIIQTGFVGTPLVLPALSDTGHLDDAYALLLQRECPSWLYALRHDATTVWERWDSMLADGTVNPGDMTSFNHYALGAVAHWLHTVVGGLVALEPGYRRVAFRPRPGGGLTWADTAHESPYGRIGLRWELAGGDLKVTALVPPGVRAHLEWPDGTMTPVPSGASDLGRPHPGSGPRRGKEH